MSSYRAIWTHFKSNFIFFEQKIPDLGPKILILVPRNIRPWSQNPDPGPKNIRSWSQNPDPGSKNIIFWVHQIVFTGGLPPPRPPAVPGGLWYQDLGKDPGTKIFVPRSWYQDLGTKILVPRSTESPRGASRYAGVHGGLQAQAPRQGVWGGRKPPRNSKGSGGGSPPVKTI